MNVVGAGKRDRCIKIEHHTEVGRSGSGAPIHEWQQKYEVYACKVEKLPDESERSKRLTTIGQATFQIQYRPDITSKMRVVDLSDNNKEYDIEGVRELGTKDMIEIDCYSKK